MTISFAHSYLLLRSDIRSMSQNWRRFRIVLKALNAEQELRGLVSWAKRKQLSEASNFYQSRLHQAEGLLQYCRAKNKWLVIGGEFAYAAMLQIRPPRPKKGMAKKYKYGLF